MSDLNLSQKQIKDLIFSKHDVTNIKADHMESFAALYRIENGELVVLETIPLTDIPQEEWKSMFSKEQLQRKVARVFYIGKSHTIESLTREMCLISRFLI